ncbi:LamG-like jellyroll fold domain-containing protein [Aeoliella sp.]|uniref:LamG-like jellyroll fold domain-containing protein n=1 Tax=Aeoliella sp. TaxID=2795800 RepID=UPI003CCC2042
MLRTNTILLACLSLIGLSGSALGQYSTEVLADSPIAYYRLEETAGSVATNSGSLGATVDGNFLNLGTGTGVNNIGQAGPRLGDLAGGFAIDGFGVDNNAIRLSPLTAPDFPGVEVPWDMGGSNPLALDGSTGLTLEAWIYRDPAVVSGADNEGIVSRYQDNVSSPDGAEGRSYNLYYDDDINAFGFAISDDGNFDGTNGVLEATDYDVPLQEWVHVAATIEPMGSGSANMNIYANGNLVANRTTPLTSLYTGAADLWIGQQFTEASNWTFEGTIDEVAVYDFPLSATRIMEHYESATTNIPTSFSWNTDASGDWNVSGNWSFNTVPNSNQQSAVLGSSISEPRVVYTNSNVTVKGLTISNGNQYVLGGTGSITLSADTGNAQVNGSGTHTIAVDVVLDSETDFSDGFVNLTGNLDLGDNNLNILSGTLNISNSVTSTSGATVVNSDTLGTGGAVDFGANLISTGTLDIDIAGENPGEFDFFNITGTATLSGVLSVELYNGYALSGDETFTVLTATSLVDNGITLVGPSSDMFALSVVGNSLVLSIDTGLDGDFNDDGIVNLADYTLWRNNLGALDDSPINDNGDGVAGIDINDYQVWKQNFGMSSAAVASSVNAVPEPASIALLALAGLFNWRRLTRALAPLAAALLLVALPATSRAQYNTAVLSSSPVAYYQLNEQGDGLTFFAENSTSETGIDAAIQNIDNFGDTGPNNIGQVGPRPGDIAGGHVIDGFANDNRSVHFGIPVSGFGRLEVTDDAVTPNPLDVTGSLTLEAWVNRDAQTDTGGNEGIVSKYVGDGGNRSYNLFYDPVPGRVGFVMSDSGAFQAANQVLSETDIALGEWTHIAATYDQSTTTMSIYINGLLSAQQVVAAAGVFDGAGDFWIGHQFSPDNLWGFEGRIDEVAVYDKALSGSEVQAHFEAATGASSGAYTWNVDGSGNWASIDNWSQASVPNRTGAVVNLGNVITSPQTVYHEDPMIIGTLNIDSAQQYAVASFSTLILRTDAGSAEINVQQGDHLMQTNIRLDDDTTLTVSSGSLSFEGTVDLNGNDLTIAGAGTVSFDYRLLPTDGGTVINTGSLALASSALVGGDLVNEGELVLGLGAAAPASISGKAYLSGTITPDLSAGFQPAPGESYLLLSAGELIDGGVALSPEYSDQFALSLSGGSLMVTAIPEPTTVLLGTLMSMALPWMYRRRQG